MSTLQRIDEKRRPGEPAESPAASDADAAYVWGIVVGSEQPLEDLMAGLRGRLEDLRDPLSPQAVSELKRQLVVLDGLFQRFAAEAVTTRKGADKQALLLRAALQAQQGYARTFALLHTLANQAKTIELLEGPADDD